MSYYNLTYKRIYSVELIEYNGKFHCLKVVNNTWEVVSYRVYTSLKQVPNCVFKFMEDNPGKDITPKCQKVFGDRHIVYGDLYILGD